MSKVVACLIGAGLLFPLVARADDQPNCRLVEVAAANMTVGPNGVPMVTTSMEGQDVPMVVDTGGTFSMVTRNTVNLLHLRPQNVPEHAFYMGATGEAIKSMVPIHNFKLGNLQADVFSMLILPYAWDDIGGGGTLSPDVFGRYDVEFDFAANKLHLWSPQHCPGKVVYWTQQPYMALPIRVDAVKQIHFSATVDGKEMDALLDTGSSKSILRLDMARAVLGWVSNPPGLQCEKDGSYCHYPFKTLSFGGVAVNNPNIDILPDQLVGLRERGEVHENTGNMHAPELIIGTSVLKNLHLYIAYREGVIYGTGAAAH